MELALPLLLLGVPLVLAGVYLARASSRSKRIWSEAGRALGLEHSSPSSPTTGLRGTVRGVGVEADLLDPDPGPARGRLRIRASASLPPAPLLELVRANLELDPRDEISDGCLTRVVEERIRTSDQLVEHIERVVREMERVACAPLAEMLLADLAPEKPANVRLARFKHLLLQFPLAEETASAIQLGLSDAAPEIRFLAVLQTGPSFEAAEAFVLDPCVPAPLRASVLEQLEPKIAYERLSLLLGRVLEVPGIEARTCAMRFIGKHQDRRHCEALCALAQRELEPALLQPLAETLADLDARSEPTMVRFLEGPSEAAKATAIVELRTWGSIHVVEPLLAVRGTRTNEDAAREAVRAIQSRLAGAETGRVSLAVGDRPTGGVSLPSGEREKV